MEAGPLPPASLYLLPQGALGLDGERRRSHCLCGTRPQTGGLVNGVYKWIFAFCYRIFLLQMTPTSLSSDITWFGGALCEPAAFKWSSIKFFDPQGISAASSLSGENFSRTARSAFSYSQWSKMFTTSPLGASLPLKHLLKPLVDSVNGDVGDPHRLYQAPACFSRIW